MTTDTETPDAAEPSAPMRGRWRLESWVCVPVILVFAVFWHALSNARVFFIRDMSFLFWPVHRWYGQTLSSGDSPLWDPFVGFGQSAISDAVRQLLFPPVALLRLFLPDALGFNLTIVFAIATAAIGAYCLGRRRFSAQGAALAASVFALSGPILSGGNMPTTIWSIALIPWTVWSADRIAQDPTVRRCSMLAILFGLQVLAGEPVSMVSGVALTFGFAVFGIDAGTRRERTSVLGCVSVSGLAGLGLAAAQLLPLLDATRRSARGIEGVPDILAAHPLAFVESIVGPIFGDPIAPWTNPQPWLAAMNDGNDPYILSLYVGVPVLLLAIVGILSGGDRRWRIFWTIALLAAVVCSVGRYTFVYPLLQKAIPLLEAFRYPSKYTGVFALSIAILAAGGWESLRTASATSNAWRSAAFVSIGLGLVGGIVWILGVVRPEVVTHGVVQLATWISVPSPETAAVPVVTNLHSAMRDLLIVSAVAGQAIVLAASNDAPRIALSRVALVLLPFLCVLCLVAHNGSLNPMLDASTLRSPQWVATVAERPEERVFAPGRIAHAVGRQFEPGIPRRTEPPPDQSRMSVEATLNEAFGVFPAVNRTREGISVDVSQIWSREYAKTIRAFAWNSPSRRATFLQRTGTRFIIDREPPMRNAVPRYDFEDYAVSLYEVEAPQPRAFVVASASIVPNADVQTERLFDANFNPNAAVLLERDAPAATGVPSPATSVPGAKITEDGTTTVTIRATVPDPDGYVVLHDTWDPYWTATVDGSSAEVVRANGLFRAVHVSSGEHVVRFTYSPTPFYVGCVITLLTILFLAVASASRLGGLPLYTRPHGEEPV